jgi:hypothetical protein
VEKDFVQATVSQKAVFSFVLAKCVVFCELFLGKEVVSLFETFV